MNKYIKATENTYAFIIEFKPVRAGLLKFMHRIQNQTFFDLNFFKLTFFKEFHLLLKQQRSKAEINS